MKLINNILFGVALLLATSSCSVEGDSHAEKVVSVGDKFLTVDDIKALVPEGVDKSDSVKVVDTFISSWVREELLVQTAEEFLPSGEKDFRLELESYRRSMLIHRYHQLLISEDTDSTFVDGEVHKFYDDNIDMFKLSGPIVKCTYIELPGDINVSDDLREIFVSSDNDDIIALETFCVQSARYYDHFNEDWIYLSKLRPIWGENINSEVNYSRKSYVVEQSDSLSQKFLVVRDYLSKGKVAPFMFVEEKIKGLIRNSRKQNFIKEIDNGIFERSKESGVVVYH